MRFLNRLNNYLLCIPKHTKASEKIGVERLDESPCDSDGTLAIEFVLIENHLSGTGKGGITVLAHKEEKFPTVGRAFDVTATRCVGRLGAVLGFPMKETRADRIIGILHRFAEPDTLIQRYKEKLTELLRDRQDALPVCRPHKLSRVTRGSL